MHFPRPFSCEGPRDVNFFICSCLLGCTWTSVCILKFTSNDNPIIFLAPPNTVQQFSLHCFLGWLFIMHSPLYPPRILLQFTPGHMEELWLKEQVNVSKAHSILTFSPSFVHRLANCPLQTKCFAQTATPIYTSSDSSCLDNLCECLVDINSLMTNSDLQIHDKI